MADGDQSSQPLLDALRADENEFPPDSLRQRTLLPHSESGIISTVLALLGFQSNAAYHGLLQSVDSF